MLSLHVYLNGHILVGLQLELKPFNSIFNLSATLCFQDNVSLLEFFNKPLM